MTPIEIVEAQFDDEGDIAFAAEFPIEPYGKALFTSPDNTEASRSILEDLSKHWDELWRSSGRITDNYSDYAAPLNHLNRSATP